jgi:hypothetical protein
VGVDDGDVDAGEDCVLNSVDDIRPVAAGGPVLGLSREEGGFVRVGWSPSREGGGFVRVGCLAVSGIEVSSCSFRLGG